MPLPPVPPPNCPLYEGAALLLKATRSPCVRNDAACRDATAAPVRPCFRPAAASGCRNTDEAMSLGNILSSALSSDLGDLGS